jgi:hypothetical protein
MIQKGETDPSSALLLRELCGYGRRSEGYSCTCQERSSTVVHMGIWENHLEIENTQRYSVNTLLPVRHREPGTCTWIYHHFVTVLVAIKKTGLPSLGLHGPSLKRQQTQNRRQQTHGSCLWEREDQWRCSGCISLTWHSIRLAKQLWNDLWDMNNMRSAHNTGW